MPYDEDLQEYDPNDTESTPQGPEEESTPQGPEEDTEEDEEDTAEIEQIASTLDSESSILDDNTALSALRLLKQELYYMDCKLIDFKIGFSATGFDIKGLKVNCRNPEKILAALKNVQVIPGQLKPQSLYDKKPNSYSVSAILATLKRQAESELGLSLRAAAYDNDYVVISFFPAEEQPQPEPEPLLAPPEEEAPIDEEPPEGEEGEEEGGEPGLDDIPIEEVDWEAMGI